MQQSKYIFTCEALELFLVLHGNMQFPEPFKDKNMDEYIKAHDILRRLVETRRSDAYLTSNSSELEKWESLWKSAYDVFPEKPRYEVKRDFSMYKIVEQTNKTIVSCDTRSNADYICDALNAYKKE